MFDSHCHLTDPRLHKQLPEVLARAAAAGVSRMVTIGTDPPDHQLALDVCRKHQQVRCALGIHPGSCEMVDESALDGLRQTLRDPAVVALGEIGLDYHYPGSDRVRQALFFERQLEIAVELGLPVVVHCREAVDDGLNILRGFPSVSSVFHCFTGTVNEGLRVLDAGYLLGFTGVITFSKSDTLRELVKLTPAERMLIETDAPYLSPEPYRNQKVNEPERVIHVAQRIAEIRGQLLDEIAKLTMQNASRFYRWNAGV